MEKEIRQYLSPNAPFTFEIHDTIDSTNRRGIQLAKQGGKPFTVVIAREQTTGRGRMERSFHSPKDSGLYLSMVLPALPTETIGLVTPYAAVATADAIAKVSGLECGIKWVNDLFSNGRKLCGILAEGALISENQAVAVIGIGINTKKTNLPLELEQIVTSIEKETGAAISNSWLAATLLEGFADIGRQITSRKFMDEYRHRSIIIGKDITVHSGTEQYTAVAVAIDDNCGLVVRVGDEIRTISAGEVSVRL